MVYRLTRLEQLFPAELPTKGGQNLIRIRPRGGADICALIGKIRMTSGTGGQLAQVKRAAHSIIGSVHGSGARIGLLGSSPS